MRSSDTIPIDKERGFDPHLCTCVRCGSESSAVTVGVLMKRTDTDDHVHYCYRGKTGRYMRGLPRGVYFRDNWQEITDSLERIPFGLCKACETEKAEHAAVVAAGGVYFKCEQCSATGVITAGSFADDVRTANKVPSGKRCGVEFQFCAQHGTKE